MDETAQAAQSIAKFLQTFTTNGGFRLRFRVKVRNVKDIPEPVDGPRSLSVEFAGPDTSILTARNGELLNALEHIAAKILRFESEEHDRVVFDADQFKANRELLLRRLADEGIKCVRDTGRSYSFPPMSSRERRTLHMMLADSGLPTASSGEGPARYVVVYPAGSDTTQPSPGRDLDAVRRAFRPR